MFVLLFTFVFGGSIPTPGFEYVDYLVPGHPRPDRRVRLVVHGRSASPTTCKRGMVDRFRVAADGARRVPRRPHDRRPGPRDRGRHDGAAGSGSWSGSGPTAASLYIVAGRAAGARSRLLDVVAVHAASRCW